MHSARDSDGRVWTTIGILKIDVCSTMDDDVNDDPKLLKKCKERER